MNGNLRLIDTARSWSVIDLDLRVMLRYGIVHFYVKEVEIR